MYGHNVLPVKYVIPINKSDWNNELAQGNGVRVLCYCSHRILLSCQTNWFILKKHSTYEKKCLFLLA